MGLSQVHTFFGKLPKAISLGKSRLSLRSNVTRRQANTTKKRPYGCFFPAETEGLGLAGDPYPSTRSAPDIQCLSKQKVKSFASLTVK